MASHCEAGELTIGLDDESMNITERAEQLDTRAAVAEGHGDDVTMRAGHLDLGQGFGMHLDHQRHGGGYVLIRHPGTSGCPAPRPLSRRGGHLFTNLGVPSLTSLPIYVGILVDANEVGQAGLVATLYMPLDDDLHRRLRVAAAMNDETIKSLVARAVEREVERIEAETGRRRR